MRVNVRSQFVDVRNNTKVGNALWEFIGEIQMNPQGLQENHADGSHKNGKKRKKGMDNESDQEYRPAPVKNLGQTPKTRSKISKTN
jgi:hypothetical protein